MTEHESCVVPAADAAKRGRVWRNAPGHGIVLIGMGDVACAALIKSNIGMVWDRRPKAIVAHQI